MAIVPRWKIICAIDGEVFMYFAERPTQCPINSIHTVGEIQEIPISPAEHVPFVMNITEDMALDESYDHVCVDASLGSFIIFLPSASENEGKQYQIKKTDNSLNSITINALEYDTIDGNSSIDLLNQYD